MENFKINKDGQIKIDFNASEEKEKVRNEIAKEHGVFPEAVELDNNGKWLISGLSPKDYDDLMSGNDNSDMYHKNSLQ